MSNSTAVTTTENKPLLVGMAEKYGLTTEEFSKTVRKVCGVPDASPEEFAGLMIAARTYGLNPIQREIYAIKAKSGALIPVVSIDGWVNLIQSHPQADGFDFEFTEVGEQLISCTCKMFRKDRQHPVVVTEYLSECIRATDPWKMKHRMLRHKALIQAARYAFGFAGIYDEDEAERIAAPAGGGIDSGPPKPNLLKQGPYPEGGDVIDGEATEVQPETHADSGPPRSQPESKPRAARKKAEDKPAETKPDPISTGSQDTIIADDPDEPTDLDSREAQAGFFSEEDEQSAPQPERVEPVRIDPAQYKGIKAWSARYQDMIATAQVAKDVFGWIDANRTILDEIKAKAPSIDAEIRKHTEAKLAALRNAGATAPKPETAPEPKPRAARTTRKSAAKDEPDFASMPEPPDDRPETVYKWVDQNLARIEDGDLDRFEAFVEGRVRPLIDAAMAPDVEALQGCIRHHEKRFVS